MLKWNVLSPNEAKYSHETGLGLQKTFRPSPVS